MSAADLIDKLNPMVRGWANYHRHVVSKRTFGRVDHTIFSVCGNGHDEDTRTKARAGSNRNTLTGAEIGTGPSSVKTYDDEGRPTKVWLYYAKSTPIQRHVKVRITGWRLHYCVPRAMGGSTGATNRVLLHPECHDRVHRQRLPIFETASPLKRRSKGLSWVKGNFHAQF
jgi:RNA-directed DNA polymerase